MSRESSFGVVGFKSENESEVEQQSEEEAPSPKSIRIVRKPYIVQSAAETLTSNASGS